MTELFEVPTSSRVNVSTAAGGETGFSYDFPIMAAADLKVIRQSAAGVQTILAYPDDYTISGIGVAEGGAITLVETATAGQVFYRIGSALLQRLTSIVQAGKYKSAPLDDDLARLTLIAQELRRDADRGYKVDYGGTGGAVTPGTDGQVATFDAAGNLVGTTPVNGVSGMPAGGLSGQVMVKQSNTSFDATWATFVGGGDMVATTYDPTSVGADAFAMDNMAEGDTKKVMTNTERNIIANLSGNFQPLDADLTAIAALSTTSYGRALLALADHAALAALVDPWAMQPIGGVIPLMDNINGVEAPPTDKFYRYVLLTAGETGSGDYNEGILTNESTSGSDPLKIATADIDDEDSALDGQTIRLINTERRFLRAGSAGTVQDSQNLLHGHPYVFSPDNDYDGGQTGGWVMKNGNILNKSAFTGTPSSAPNEKIGGSGGDEARPRNLGVTYYMRIK